MPVPVPRRRGSSQSTVVRVHAAGGFTTGDRVIYKGRLRGTVEFVTIYLPTDRITLYVRLDDPKLNDMVAPFPLPERRLEHLGLVERVGELGEQ